MSNRSQGVLLSGGSGWLGGALQRALAGRGVPVLQLVRTGEVKLAEAPESNARSKALLVAVPGQFPWNPAANPPIVHRVVVEGLRAAIHLSGANAAGHRWSPAYKREMWASRVRSTHALATVLAGLKNPPKVLLVASATGIYGNRGDELLDEDSAPGAGFLADLCREWEEAAQPAVAAGIRVVHLRFGVVLGPGGGALAKMLPLFRLGLGGRLGDGRQWMSWIGLTDAMGAMLFALENEAIAGPVNLTASEPVTNAEFTRALGRAVHRPALLPAPAFALRLAVGEMADEALLASARVMPKKLTEAGFVFAQPTVDAALAAAI
jgi:uncharacterized protein (TIGR01777 family)